jgi:transposase
MSNPADRVEIITSVQRRRRWAAAEKVRMVEETFEPGMTVTLVVRRHGCSEPALHLAAMTDASPSMSAAAAGAPTALRLAATTVNAWGSPSRSIAVTARP